jgi:hypothetical protein
MENRSELRFLKGMGKVIVISLLPVASLLTSRIVYHQPSTKVDAWVQMLETIRLWKSECEKSHPKCRIQLEGKYDANHQRLPTRLIDVGLDDGPDPPRLVLTSALSTSETSYITLSHCWGTTPGTTSSTTIANLKDRLQNLPELPFTFQQAIALARYINIRYLWIDSICIVQDDPEDVRSEFSTMASVYGNATCNLLASSSKNSAEGCHNPSGLYPLRPCILKWRLIEATSYSVKSVMVHPAMPAWQEVIGGSEGGPLSQRGWVVQERHLAKRAIHFSPRRLVWQCSTVRAFRDYPDQDLVYENSRAADPQEVFQEWPVNVEGIVLGDYLKDPQNSVNLDNVYQCWFELVAEYTSMALTKEEDKLRALAGLARATSEIIKDVYLAGLWKKDLVRQLCWFECKTYRGFMSSPKAYRAPSWSWAAVDGPVQYPTFDYSPTNYGNPMAPEILEATVKTEEKEVYGPVTAGFLRLRGRLAVVVPAFEDFDLTGAVWTLQTLRRARIAWGNEFGMHIGVLIIDLPFWTTRQPRKNFYILRLWQFDWNHVQVLEDDNRSWECRFLGLGLELVSEVRQEYKRLGLVYLRPEVVQWFTPNEDIVELTMI